MSDLKLEKHDLGEKIIKSSKANLFLRMHFFGLALGSLKSFEADTSFFIDSCGLGTDCTHLFFNTNWLISEYQNKQNLIQRAMIHSLLHCIYKHPLLKNIYFKERLYHIACDIIVEYLIDQMRSHFLYRHNLQDREYWYKILLGDDKHFILKKLCYKLTTFDEDSLETLEKHFIIDSHLFWPNRTAENDESSRNDNDQNQNNNDKIQTEISSAIKQISGKVDIQKLQETWDNIANQIKLDLELFSKSIGNETRGLEEYLKISLRKTYDYKEILNRFLANREIYREDLDSFDPIYYTYGLIHYSNIALIEYLEYKEQKVLDELVILIDTSGSTYGEEVIKFLELTYDIVTRYSNDSLKYKLVFIQIDMTIQEVKIIKSNQEFKDYMDHFVLKGMGGTDFRPGFMRVNTMIENNELTRLKGIIYFTDGYGEFPKEPPTYETMIVFYEDPGNVSIPSWAQKVVIREEDLI